MEYKMKPVIFFDIDETLYFKYGYPNNLTQIQDAIAKMKNTGFKFGLCTQRPFDDFVKNLADIYGINSYIISEGGACIYEKNYAYGKVFGWNNLVKSLNSQVKELITAYLRKEKIITPVVIDCKFDCEDIVYLNKFREETSTIRLPRALQFLVNDLIYYLKTNPQLTNYNISQDPYSSLKINIVPLGLSKVVTIQKFIEGNSILITDYESEKTPHDTRLEVYSVGNNSDFNNYCNKVYSPGGEGIIKILKEKESL